MVLMNSGKTSHRTNGEREKENSCDTEEEIPFEAISTSAEWIREDVQAVAEAFSLNSGTLLKACLKRLRSDVTLARLR